MSNTPHTLGQEFPGQLRTIHALKARDTAFAGLLADYDRVNDLVHRAETRLDAISEDDEHALRKRRLAIKDAIAAALSRAA